MRTIRQRGPAEAPAGTKPPLAPPGPMAKDPRPLIDPIAVVSAPRAEVIARVGMAAAFRKGRAHRIQPCGEAQPLTKTRRSY